MSISQPGPPVMPPCSQDCVKLAVAGGATVAVLSEFVMHYNEHRPRQSRDQRPPNATDAGPAVIVDFASARVHRRPILNGLINEYSQVA